MSKTVLSSLIVGLLSGVLVWLSAYLSLPFWYCLLSSALFFAASQSNLQSLFTTLVTALLGILFAVIYIQINPYIPNFPYKMEVFVAIIVFILFLITRTQYLRYFACSLITLSLLVLQNGNWIIVCQAVVIGILFGFVARAVSLLIMGKDLN